MDGFGVQLITRRYREDICLAAAETIERTPGAMADRLHAGLAGGRA
jgi:hypothetical protein